MNTKSNLTVRMAFSLANAMKCRGAEKLFSLCFFFSQLSLVLLFHFHLEQGNFYSLFTGSDSFQLRFIGCDGFPGLCYFFHVAMDQWINRFSNGQSGVKTEINLANGNNFKQSFELLK